MPRDDELAIAEVNCFGRLPSVGGRPFARQEHGYLHGLGAQMVDLEVSPSDPYNLARARV